MSDVQIAIIDQENIEVNLAVPGIQGAKGDTGTVGVAADGIAAAPGISFASDTNTGIYRPGADQLAISTGGTGRLSIDANGNVAVDTNTLYVDAVNNRVGLGTSSPTNSFHISGTSSTPAVFERTGSNGVFAGLKDASGNFVYLGNTNGVFSVQTAGSSYSDKLVVTSAGLVGVGTTSPGQQLTVATNTGNCYIEAKRASQSAGQVALQLTGGTSGTDWILYQPASSNDLRIFGNSNDRVTVTSAGSVGIGTTTPGTRLCTYDTSGGNTTQFRVGFSDSYAWDISRDNAATGDLIFKNSSGGAFSERARIDSSGRLLVGTSTNTGGSLFQVNDNRIRIATAKTPASATDTGSAGEICWDANYIYVCTATNTWKRTAIATW